MNKLAKGIVISLSTVAVATFVFIGAGVYFVINESSDELIKRGEKFLDKFKKNSTPPLMKETAKANPNYPSEMSIKSAS